MLKLIITILICCCLSSAVAQKHIFIGWNVGLGRTYSKVEDTGLPYQNLKGIPGISPKIGVGLKYAFSSSLFLQTGFKVQYKVFQVSHLRDFTILPPMRGTIGTIEYSIPLEIKYRLPFFKKSNKRYLSVTGGVLFEYYPESFGIWLGGGGGDYINYEFATSLAALNVEKKLVPSIKIGFGLNKITKRNNIYELSLNCIYSPLQVMNGTFVYWDGYFLFPPGTDPNDLSMYPPPDEEYNVFSRGSVLSLEIRYWYRISWRAN